MQLLLWRLPSKRKRKPARRGPSVKRPAVRTVAEAPRRKPAPPAANSMAERYERMTRTMLDRHGVRVRKWRTSMSGVAWQVTYHDGTVSRLIESPRPRGPMSAAVFLHEIGHHAIGFNVYRPRCLEEYHAWRYSLEQMREWDLNVTPAVERRMHESLHYAIAKAARRGLKRLPVELIPYADEPPPRPARGPRRRSADRA